MQIYAGVNLGKFGRRVVQGSVLILGRIGARGPICIHEDQRDLLVWLQPPRLGQVLAIPHYSRLRLHDQVNPLN